MNFKIDLKNIDLKNISLEDIKSKLKRVEKKTWIKVGISAGAVVIFLIIFYGVLNPIVNKKKADTDANFAARGHELFHGMLWKAFKSSGKGFQNISEGLVTHINNKDKASRRAKI